MNFIKETFSDGDVYYHHVSCFDLEVAVDMNRLLHLGTVTYEAVNVKEFTENNDGMPPVCFLCLKDIRSEECILDSNP